MLTKEIKDSIELFKKYIMPFIIFIFLLVGMAFFPYIPIYLFKIPYESLNITIKAIYLILCDIGFMLILFLLYKDKIIKDFKNYFKKFMNNFEEGFKYYFIGVIIMMASNLFISFVITDAIAGNEEAVREMIDSVPLYMIFSVSIYAPFIEELIFRHSIKDSVMCFGNSKLLKYTYVFISGFVFALMHILGQATSILDYVYIVPYMSLGVAFSLLYSKTDNIFSSISMHCLHNTFTIILYFIAGGAI